MKRFKYKAKDKSGNVVAGEVEASSMSHAAKLVKQRELILITLRQIREFAFNPLKKLSDRVSAGDLTTFTRQLATMVNSGLPLTESLLVLRSQLKGAMQQITAQILADVEEGGSLSSSMSKHPSVFAKSYVALIKSGEMGGVLDEVLSRLANNLEKQQEFTGKVKGALIYPIIIVIGMLIVALIMLIFVIPRMLTLYEQFDAELPLPTKILMGISTITTKYWPFLLAAIGTLLYGFKLYRSTKAGRRTIDEKLLKIPLIGPLQHQIVLTDLTRTLALMIGSGVSIIESSHVASEVATNVVVSDGLTEAAGMVEKGFPVAFAFSRYPAAFPYILSQMIAVGEETGKMDEVLEKVSHVFEVESEQKLKA
ncbi:type II secretion system F family protein, partial [bacterium]|nr:type II secretion system F family protein [bacterium]